LRTADAETSTRPDPAAVSNDSADSNKPTARDASDDVSAAQTSVAKDEEHSAPVNVEEVDRTHAKPQTDEEETSVGLPSSQSQEGPNFEQSEREHEQNVQGPIFEALEDDVASKDEVSEQDVVQQEVEAVTSGVDQADVQHKTVKPDEHLTVSRMPRAVATTGDTSKWTMGALRAMLTGYGI
jgi:hypothetical protein